jgi:hypothetical protein
MWPLLVGLIITSMSGFARLAISVRDWYWFNRFGLQPGPGYLAVSGAAWGLAALAALIWIGLRLKRYPWVGITAVLFLMLTYWLDRLVFSRPDGAWVSLPFGLISTLLMLVYVFLVLRPIRFRFFHKNS